MGRMARGIGVAGIALLLSASVVPARENVLGEQGVAQEYELDEQDVALLQRIARQDKYFDNMKSLSEVFAGLRKVLALVTPGPAKLVVKWHQGAVDGFARAHSTLHRLHLENTCQVLVAHAAGNSNEEVFIALMKARGCP